MRAPGARAIAIVLACAALNCGRASGPTAPTPFQAKQRAAIQGVVRAVNGGPLADASVQLKLALGGGALASTTTNAAGEFSFPAADGCTQGVLLWGSLPGYRTQNVSLFPCVTDPGTTPFSANISLLEDFALSLDAESQGTLQVALSNENPDLSNLYPCSPCTTIALPPPGALPLEITITLSTNEGLWAGVEAAKAYNEYGLAQVQSTPGQNTITLTMPVDWNMYDYRFLLIGLPKGTLSAPVTVHVSIGPASSSH